MQTQSPPAYQQLLHLAESLFRKEPDWVTFFREILGIEGAVRKTFPSFDDLTAFERSEEYEQIQKLLVKLREKKPSADAPGDSEPTRVITVRLPQSMHEYLRTEAHDLRTSMNKLCISKLLQVIEQDMIPSEKTSPPKRRTTPAPSPAPAQQPLTGAPRQETRPAPSQPTLGVHSGNGHSGYGSSF